MTKRERNRLIYDRYEAGYSQEEISEFYGLSQSRVSEIIIALRTGVPERTEETRGAKSRLSPADLEKLSDLLISGQGEEGFSGWTKWSVKALIEKEFRVVYHENYIWEIMKKIGFTSRLPSKKDYRQDKEKVRMFKEDRAPEYKKSGIGKS